MSHATRSLSRTFVLLDRRLTAVPSSAELSRMMTAGKVKEISFTKSQNADVIGTNLTAAFPSLGIGGGWGCRREGGRVGGREVGSNYNLYL